jgi:hypothetical protein
MYSVRSAAEFKPDMVVVVEAVAVGLDEADPDEVADAAVAVVDVRPLSTGLLLLWIAITAYQQRRRMTEVATRHLLMIQPFRILMEAMPEINSVATLTDAAMLVADPQHVMSNLFVRFDRSMPCCLRVQRIGPNSTHMMTLVLLAQISHFMQRLGKQ